MNEAQTKLFLKTIVHDLRGSLGASSSLADMLVEHYADCLDEKGKHWLSLISSEYKQSQNKLVATSEFIKLLDYSPRFERCDLDKVLKESIEKHQNSDITKANSSKNIEFNVLYNISAFLTSNKRLLEMYFLELMQNSACYAISPKTSTQSALVSVRISYQEYAEHHLIIFEDAGDRLTISDIEHIVKPFKTVFKERIPSGSAGLGLFKLRQIARILRGTIEFSIGDAPYCGLQVALSLPKKPFSQSLSE